MRNRIKETRVAGGLKENETVEGNLETRSPIIHTIGETTSVASMKA
jgi:hypothetical protein